MKDDQKLEYQELRNEFASLTQMIATTMNFSVAGCIVVLSIIFPIIKTGSSIILFWLPLLLIYPSILLIVSRLQGIQRIASYIIVFIESNSDLKWETRLLKFKINQKFQFRKTLLWIFLALIFFDIAIFSFYGHFQIIDISCYLASLILFWLIYRNLDKGWKEIYIKKWAEIKLNEESANK